MVLTGIRLNYICRRLEYDFDSTSEVLRKWYVPRYGQRLKEARLVDFHALDGRVQGLLGLKPEKLDSQLFQQFPNPPDDDNSVSSQDKSTATPMSSSTRTEFVREIIMGLADIFQI